MCPVKGQVPFERQMEVNRAGQKRKNAQREAHQETEKIKIGPGHKSPRARRYFPQLAGSGARAGIRDRDLVNYSGHTRPALLSCEAVKPAADGRCPFVRRCHDCRGVKLLRAAPLNPGSGEFPPAAKSRAATLRAPQWSGARAEAPDRP